MPLFATVGLREKAIRPLAIDDLVRVLRAALVDACLARQTVAITGAQALSWAKQRDVLPKSWIGESGYFVRRSGFACLRNCSK